jgi:adenosine kinase
LGSKGSLIENRLHRLRIPRARALFNLDPTGAGDAYRAGFMTGLIKFIKTKTVAKLSAKELLECGLMGSVAAVYTVEKYGTQTHSYTKKEFIRRYWENFQAMIEL